MDGLIQIQAVVQGSAEVVCLVGLDTQGRVSYGELSAISRARSTIKWTSIEERR